MNVFFSEIAEHKLIALTDYLLENWSYKVKTEFIATLNAKITQIATYPESCIQSKELGGIFKCVVTKQTTFFYRIDYNQKEIEIITLFDTRQDPKKRNKLII